MFNGYFCHVSNQVQLVIWKFLDSAVSSLCVWQFDDVVLNTPSSSIKVFITLLYSFISGNVAFHSVVTKYRTQPFITINKPSKKKKKTSDPTTHLIIFST